MTSEKCSKCDGELKRKEEDLFGVKGLLTLNYCPKCEVVNAVMPQLATLMGRAQRGINRKTGQTRIRGIFPEDWKDRDAIVQTFPRYVVTKPSEMKVSSRGRIYTTQERRARVYPELSRGDTVLVSGFLSENILFSSVLLNQDIGIKNEFVENQIRLEKGIFRSFTIDNPILAKSMEAINDLVKKQET